MDFAKKQLEKYGWKEGDGIGKDGNKGIKQAIKPNYKIGNAGVGFDHSKELVDTWWSRVYDDSLKRVSVNYNETDEGVNVAVNNDGSDEMSGMRKRMHKANFVKFSKKALLDNGEEIETNIKPPIAEDVEPKSKSQILNFDDPDLMKVCEGRTAHKAARFGLKLSGKLARIAAQEENIMKQMNKKDDKEKPNQNCKQKNQSLDSSSSDEDD